MVDGYLIAIDECCLILENEFFFIQTVFYFRTCNTCIVLVERLED